AGEADQEDEFLPAVDVDRVGEADVDVRLLGGVREGGELLVVLAVDAAAAHLRELAGLRDHAGRRDDGRDIGHAADYAVGPEDGREALDRVDAVLQGDDARVGADD